MCNCIDILEKDIEKRFGDFEWLNIPPMINFETGERPKRFPPLKFSCFIPKKDGTPSKKRMTRLIGGPFCPLCGLEYSTGKPAKIKRKKKAAS